MKYHPNISASQLYLDANGNAAFEQGNSLVVLLAGTFTRTRLTFKEARGPVWSNPYATVRLDARGRLQFTAGANHLVLHPVPAASRVVGLVHHGDLPFAFAGAVDALRHAKRTDAAVTWQPVTDLPATARLVGLR